MPSYPTNPDSDMRAWKEKNSVYSVRSVVKNRPYPDQRHRIGKPDESSIDIQRSIRRHHTMALNDLKTRAQQETHALLNQAELHFGRGMPQVEICFDLKGKAAGSVRLIRGSDPLIRYNGQLLKENGETFLQQTIPHEVAHVVAYRLHGQRIRPHGPEWQQVMALFGAEASRCHQFDTRQSKSRQLRQFDYRCGCRSHQLSSIRHNRVTRGQVYLCRQCGQSLEYAG